MRAIRTAALAAGALAGCGPIDLEPTRGRVALLAAFAILLLAVMLAGVAGRGSDKDTAKPGDPAGGGWVILAFVSAIAALVIGTCNTFTAAPAREPAPRTGGQPAAPPSVGCDQALHDADRAYADLDQAQGRARAASIALDRACRVEAAPAPPADAAPAQPPR